MLHFSIRKVVPVVRPVGLVSVDMYNLTKQEIRILTMLAEGWPAKRVASNLGIIEQTVKTHAYNARRKMGAENTTHSVAILMREGVIK